MNPRQKLQAVIEEMERTYEEEWRGADDAPGAHDLKQAIQRAKDVLDVIEQIEWQVERAYKNSGLDFDAVRRIGNMLDVSTAALSP